MKNILDYLIKDNIGEPPWEYNFLVNLDEKEYPKYLAKIFKYRTGEKLPLKYDFKNQAWIINKKRCKTFNQKIQWIKMHGVTPLMRMCTDKVAVRDYVKEKIGEEYLKPVLQIIPTPTQETRHSEYNDNSGTKNLDQLSYNTDITTYFDQIQWDKLPNAFVMKCNHGSKWQYIIKDKEQYLNTPQLVEITKRQMTGWLEQEYFPWNGFEMQYKTYTPHPNPPHTGRENVYSHSIVPKILIEPFFHNEDNTPLREIEVYCFYGKPKIFVNIRYANQREISYYDENFNQIDLILHPDGKNVVIDEKADDYINQLFDLSIKLSNDFNFVRCDWIVFNNKLYFNEMTFTPYSGLIKFDKKWNLKLSSYLSMGDKYEF